MFYACIAGDESPVPASRTAARVKTAAGGSASKTAARGRGLRARKTVQESSDGGNSGECSLNKVVCGYSDFNVLVHKNDIRMHCRKAT